MYLDLSFVVCNSLRNAHFRPTSVTISRRINSLIRHIAIAANIASSPSSCNLVQAMRGSPHNMHDRIVVRQRRLWQKSLACVDNRRIPNTWVRRTRILPIRASNVNQRIHQNLRPNRINLRDVLHARRAPVPANALSCRELSQNVSNARIRVIHQKCIDRRLQIRTWRPFNGRVASAIKAQINAALHRHIRRHNEPRRLASLKRNGLVHSSHIAAIVDCGPHARKRPAAIRKIRRENVNV